MVAVMKLAVAGAQGRMGQALVAEIMKDMAARYVGGMGRVDGAGLISRAIALDQADVIVDFSNADAATDLAMACAKRGGPALVIGATGFDRRQLVHLSDAARVIPIVRSGNFSIGLNVLLGLIRQAASALPAESWDIEIIEAHHHLKIDAPSGTALMLGEAAAGARGQSLRDVARPGRSGVGRREPGEIGFATVRAGGIVGEHSVLLASTEEVITLAHSALDRAMFAKGALRAAHWLHGRSPGEYDMQSVLGL